MQLRTKLVLSAMVMTFAMVLLLSTIFVGELLRQRIVQTVSANEVLAHEVLLMTRQAIETGLRAKPLTDRSDEVLQAAVTDALRHHEALLDTMNAVIRYSPTVQDVSVTDAKGMTLVSTDPDTLDQPEAKRESLNNLSTGSAWYQVRQVFGPPTVFDIAMPLDRYGKPLVIVHMGVRSSFLRASYEPWFEAALWFTLGASILSMLASAVLASAAL